MRLIRGYPVKFCHKHPMFNQGFKKYCFICGTDIYKWRINSYLTKSMIKK